MTRWSWAWITIIVASSLGAGIVIFMDVVSAVRPLLTLWFLFVCPGMAFIGLLRLDDRLAELMLAIALSFALDAIVALAMLYGGAWSPKWGFIVLVCLSQSGVILQIGTAMARPVVPRGDTAVPDI